RQSHRSPQMPAGPERGADEQYARRHHQHDLGEDQAEAILENVNDLFLHRGYSQVTISATTSSARTPPGTGWRPGHSAARDRCGSDERRLPGVAAPPPPG